MPATVAVIFDNQGSNGAPANNTNITGLGPPELRFKTADNATIDTINPIPIPTSGTKYSYWKQIYLEVTGGTFTQIDNVKIYSDGSNFGTGITLNVGDETPTHNSGSDAGYEVATGTPDDTGDEVVATHTGITGVTNMFSFTGGSPKSVSISEAGGVINATGESTDYVVLQVAVLNTATAGDLPDETLTFQYDEI